jgi:pyridoxamine 5'-phosphate oxidase
MNPSVVGDGNDPVAIFQSWLQEAAETELNDPNAAALATAMPDGLPSVRMVLMKKVDDRGFCFYTNSESRKGRELAANPRAALCFYWKSLGRQVRVEGPVLELPAADVDAYFHSRARESQLGSAVSRQSQPLESREKLEQLVAELAEKYPGDVPRPERWKGYAIQPERIELWISGPHRLHDRFLFVREGDWWVKQRLFP